MKLVLLLAVSVCLCLVTDARRSHRAFSMKALMERILKKGVFKLCRRVDHLNELEFQPSEESSAAAALQPTVPPPAQADRKRRLEVNATQAVQLLDSGLMDLLYEMCADEIVETHDYHANEQQHGHEGKHEGGFHGNGGGAFMGNGPAGGFHGNGGGAFMGNGLAGRSPRKGGFFRNGGGAYMGSGPAGGSPRKGGFFRNGGGAAMGNGPAGRFHGNRGGAAMGGFHGNGGGAAMGGFHGNGGGAAMGSGPAGFMQDERRWHKGGSANGGQGGKGAGDYAAMGFHVPVASGPYDRRAATESGPAGESISTIGADLDEVNEFKVRIVQTTARLCRLAELVEDLLKGDEESQFADLMYDACYFLESTQGDGSVPESISPLPEATTLPPRTTGLPISGRAMSDKPGFFRKLVSVCTELVKLGEDVAFKGVDEAELVHLGHDFLAVCSALIDIVDKTSTPVAETLTRK